MACKSCAERRKKLQALRDAKKRNRQGVQAAAIGAALGAFEVGGKILGINGEEEQDGRRVETSGGAIDSGDSGSG